MGRAGSLCCLAAGGGLLLCFLVFMGHYLDSMGRKQHCRVRVWVLSMQGRVISAGESSGGVKQLRWMLA